MHDAWGPSRSTRLQTLLERFEGVWDEEWREEDLRFWWTEFEQNKESTLEKRLNSLEFMATYEPAPVQLHGSLRDFVESFLIYWKVRKTQDSDAGHGALQNDLKAVKTLGSWFEIPDGIWPKAPAPPDEDRDLPSPEQVYDLLHTQYEPNASRDPANALIVYLIVWAFGIGARIPSEAYAARVQDVDLEAGTVLIREPKKGDRTRRLYIEPEWLCTGRTRLSLANWLTWRDKMNPTTDALFPRPDGSAWPSKKALNQHLKRRVKEHHGWFNGRLGRHWCATARLIEWDGDYGRAAEWLGHEKQDRVRNVYGRAHRVWKQTYGGDWLERAWQRPRNKDPPESASLVQDQGGREVGPAWPHQAAPLEHATSGRGIRVACCAGALAAPSASGSSEGVAS